MGHGGRPRPPGRIVLASDSALGSGRFRDKALPRIEIEMSYRLDKSGAKSP